MPVIYNKKKLNETYYNCCYFHYWNYSMVYISIQILFDEYSLNVRKKNIMIIILTLYYN